MKRSALVICVVLMLMFALALIAQGTVGIRSQGGTSNKEQEYTGYLSDARTGSIYQDSTATIFMTHPEKLTLETMQSPTAMASGYGMFIRNNSGNYIFHKFDKNGSTMIRTQIITKTQKPDHLYVRVKGSMGSNGTIAVKAVSLEPEPATPDQY